MNTEDNLLAPRQLGMGADVRERAVLRILEVADMLTRIGDSSIFGETLTQPQFNILMILRRLDHDGVSQKEILEHLVSTKGNVSIHIGNLARKGYVRKRTSKADGRANVVTLTAKGRRVLDRLEPKYVKQLQDVTGNLPREQIEGAISLLDSLRERCQETLGLSPGASKGGNVS